MLAKFQKSVIEINGVPDKWSYCLPNERTNSELLEASLTSCTKCTWVCNKFA